MPAKNNADLRAAFNMEPKDAVAFFRAKGFQITDQWQEMATAAHARAFTVAKAMRMDILEDIREATDAAISEGITEREFINRLAPALKRKGWWGKDTWKDALGNDREVQLGSVHRLKTIFRANTSSAYMAGRYRRQLAAVNERPYWQYIAVRDDRTRPSHRRLHGKVFRWDDPIWQYIYPPNGWGCRCTVRNLTERQLKRQGLAVERGEDYLQMVQREIGTDVETGEVMTVDHPVLTLPDGTTMSPDLGWSGNAGALAFGVDSGIARKLGEVASTDLRSQVIQSLNNSELRQKQFGDWVDQVLASRRAGHGLASVGLLTESLAKSVLQRTGNAPSRLLVIGEKQLLHADSDRHRKAGLALSPEAYRALPRMLANPQAVLWDKKNRNLVYVAQADSQAGYKVVVNAPYRLKRSEPAPLDVVINAYQAPMRNLRDRNQYELLEGTLEGME